MLRQLPNLLTLSRLLCAFVFAFVPPAARPYLWLWAAVSEFLDGWLARRFNAETALGRFLDPFADKFFVLTVLTTLLHEGVFSLGDLILIGYRDLTVIGGALVVLVSGKRDGFLRMPPVYLGKVATFAQFVFLGMVLALGRNPNLLLALVFVIQFAAAVAYVREFFKNNLQTNAEMAAMGILAPTKRGMIVVVAIGMLLGFGLAVVSRLYRDLLAEQRAAGTSLVIVEPENSRLHVSGVLLTKDQGFPALEISLTCTGPGAACAGTLDVGGNSTPSVVSGTHAKRGSAILVSIPGSELTTILNRSCENLELTIPAVGGDPGQRPQGLLKCANKPASYVLD